ncbi:hypothetical protein IKG10_01515 [Candidatus Saccharibacteria bacterium]|nr:hypothetical protein [Candidatus Saccharibacteria bacterium]
MGKDKLNSLIQSYIRAKESGEFGEETNYNDLMESYREWQRENILDYKKLKGYSDSEFAEKFGEMFDYSDGDASSHALNRGMHFKTDESRLAVRSAFENTVGYIVNPENDRFELLEEVLDTNSPYKVPGIGTHMATTLINAKYPDVPPINSVTKEFFSNIGEPLPAKLSDAQHEVNHLFSEILELSHGKLDFDDANHILWYTSKIESGRAFMRQNYAVTFENKTATRKKSATARKKPLTHEERVADYLAHFQALQNQATEEE